MAYEEYEPVDEGRYPGQATSYDLLAQACGCTSSELRKSATIRRLKSTCRIYTHLVTYAQKSGDGLNVNVQRIYKIDRKNEQGRFGDKYRILLWHGTSPSAVAGIINTGFRKGSSGCFGGGVYFADRLAKSAGYAGITAQNTRFFFIAEVRPGKVYKAHHIHSNYSSPPAGFDSVKGNGRQIPTWRQNKYYHGAILPLGDTRPNPRFSQYDLMYSEYILYDPSRIIIRFLVECTF